MILLTIREKKHLFHNSAQDDFLRFIPKRFACAVDEIKIEVVDDAELLARDRMNADRTVSEIQSGLVYEIEPRGDSLWLVRHEPPTMRPGDADGDLTNEDGSPVFVSQADARCNFRVVEVSKVKLKEAAGWPYAGDVFTGVQYK